METLRRRSKGALGLLPGTAVLTILVFVSEGWCAAGGARLTPDGKRLLISRDVGSERWAITRNRGTGTLTGNVFRIDGGLPQFVWCEPTAIVDGSDPAKTRHSFDCYGTDTCYPGNCPVWNFLAAVTLTGEFLAEDANEIEPDRLSESRAADVTIDASPHCLADAERESCRDQAGTAPDDCRGMPRADREGDQGR